VVVSLVITTIFVEFSSIRWLSVFTITIVVIWIFAVRYAGTKFKDDGLSAKQMLKSIAVPTCHDGYSIGIAY